MYILISIIENKNKKIEIVLKIIISSNINHGVQRHCMDRIPKLAKILRVAKNNSTSSENFGG